MRRFRLTVLGITLAAVVGLSGLRWLGSGVLRPIRLAEAAEAGGAGQSTATRPIDLKSARVLVANIRVPMPEDAGNTWAERRDLLLHTVLRQDADIIGFQEVSPAQGSFLVTHLKEFDLVPARQANFSSVLGPLTNVVGSLNELYFRKDRWKLIGSDGGPLRPNALQDNVTENTFYTMGVLSDVHHVLPILIVIDTHLRHGVPNAVICAQRIHAIIAEQQKAHPGAQAIVMGDMNHDRMTMPLYPVLLGDKGGDELHDTFDYTQKFANVRWGTWHNFTGHAAGNWPTDLIFVTGGLAWESAQIVTDHDEKTGKYPSDHFFVRTTVKLVGKP